MPDPFPLVPISQDQLNALIAAMLVYQQYRLKKTPHSEERAYTLIVLALLLPKLASGTVPREGEIPLLLSEDDVRVMKGGLTTLIDNLNRKSPSRQVRREITRLKGLKTMIEHNFSTTQD